MSEDKAVTERALAIQHFKSLDLTDPSDIAEVMVASRFFKDAAGLNAAAAKIIAGRELGFGPFASMQGIDIVEGKMRLTSATLGTLVKEHPDYEYRVREWDVDHCVVEFFGRMLDGSGGFEPIGFGSFTIEEAKQGRIHRNAWLTYPRAMLWARAMSNGVNAHCPNVGKGIRIYTEGDDFGAIRNVPDPTKTDDLNTRLETEIEVKAVVTDVPEGPKPTDPEFCEDIPE